MSPAGINGPIIFSETINPRPCVTHILTPFSEHLSDYQTNCALFPQDIATAHNRKQILCDAHSVSLVTEQQAADCDQVARSEPVKFPLLENVKGQI